MISYTDAQMEQERNDPKWLVVNGVKPNISMDLVIDIIRLPAFTGYGSTSEKAIVFSWETIHKYRLHNSPGYKDGIAIDEPDATKYTLQDNGDWLEDKVNDPIRKYTIMETMGSTHFSYPDGTISDVHIIDGMSNGIKYMLVDNKWVIDEQAGCKITELKEQNKDNGWVEGDLPAAGTKCEAIWNESPDGGAMGWQKVTYKRGFDSKLWFSHNMTEIVIPAHNVTFRPILTPKQRTIEAAVESIKSTLDDSAEYLSANIIHTIALELSLDKLLTLPGESND